MVEALTDQSTKVFHWHHSSTNESY